MRLNVPRASIRIKKAGDVSAMATPFGKFPSGDRAMLVGQNFIYLRDILLIDGDG